VSIGGAQGNNAAIGKIIGPSFSALQMPEVIDRLLQVYLRDRFEGESFAECVAASASPVQGICVRHADREKGGRLVGEDEYVSKNLIIKGREVVATTGRCCAWPSRSKARRTTRPP
jgi:sulfite reductase (NADPH) hemoprotein beta-component